MIIPPLKSPQRFTAHKKRSVCSLSRVYILSHLKDNIYINIYILSFTYVQTNALWHFLEIFKTFLTCSSQSFFNTLKLIVGNLNLFKINSQLSRQNSINTLFNNSKMYLSCQSPFDSSILDF